MSGICGIWRRGNPAGIADVLASITEGLSLAGPEKTACKVDQGAALGVSARFGAQQICETPRTLLACDADLLNEAELQEELGYREPASHGGAEVATLLALLYERYGCGFVERLRGSFSVIVWDRLNRKLVAAIDGFGMNRLVYYNDGKLLLVGSRVDALVRCGEIDRNVNPRAIANVLNFSVNLGPGTIFTKVQRLLPGTMLIASEGQVRIERYWDMQYGTGSDFNEKRLSRKLESVVEAAVAVHARGGIPFQQTGAFLSGGTDSSTVVGMMSRMGEGPPKAFSIGFQEQPFNELGYAEIAAKRFAAEHHTYLVGPEDCFSALPQMVRYFDEPFGNSSAIPTYFCARLAAQTGVKMLLAGDGGDELFGGNERYATDKIFQVYHSIPNLLRRSLLEPLLQRMPFKGGLPGKARGYARRANMSPIERLLSFQFLAMHAAAEVFEPGFYQKLAGYSITEIPSRYFAEASAQDDLDRLLYVDVKVTLGDSDLPKVTQMCELAGIQVRFPFLDRSVAAFSGCIPARLKVKGFEKRYLFKRAFRELLPIEIIKKKKHGFGIPVSTWLKTDPKFRELSRDILLSRRAFDRSYFRREFVEDLFRKHEEDQSAYYGDTLWTFLTLELWHRQIVDQPAVVAI